MEIIMDNNASDYHGAASPKHVFPVDDGPFVYSSSDIEQALALPADACPRRYCCNWDSPSFHWERSPTDGCLFLVGDKPGWKYAGIPCCRSDPSSLVDHFQPNELFAKADKVDLTKWEVQCLENHRRLALDLVDQPHVPNQQSDNDIHGV
jgi:hypothetical protein